MKGISSLSDPCNWFCRHDQGPTKRNRKRNTMDYEDPEKEFKKERRAARFQHGSHSKKLRLEPLILQINNLDTVGSDGLDWNELKIVGICQDITKHYLRLTCAPDPSTVRPVSVSTLSSKNVLLCFRSTCSNDLPFAFYVMFRGKLLMGLFNVLYM